MPSHALVQGSRVILYPILRLFYRVRAYGLSNIPKTGGVIVAINHASFVDPPLVTYYISGVRPFRSIGKKELYDIPILGSYLRAVGTFPVDRDKGGLGAMREALKLLKNGELFLMAPEGTRGTAERKRAPKPGVAFIAHHAKVPVVPTRLAGTAWPQVPGKVWVKFGKPVHFDPGTLKTLGKVAAYQDFSNKLIEGIYAMEEGD